jgi:hypothetical protein
MSTYLTILASSANCCPIKRVCCGCVRQHRETWRSKTEGSHFGRSGLMIRSKFAPQENATARQSVMHALPTQHVLKKRLAYVAARASEVWMAAYPAVERVELVWLYKVVLVSIQPARCTPFNRQPG